MKILYVCHFANSGWGYAAFDWIKAMDSVGLDVVVRNIPLNNSSPIVPDRVKELESKSSRGCDVVIQNVLPHHMEYNGLLKNIGSYFYESDDLDKSIWGKKLSLMDEVWTPHSRLTQYTRSLNLNSHTIPPATDVEKFNKTYGDLPTPDKYKDDFKFYTICDVNVRKNLKALIMAFHLEFRKNEPASLILKLNKFGDDKEKIFDSVTADINRIKQSMRIYPSFKDYKYEIIIPGSVSEESVYGIHKGCDCFVSTSHGEGWCIPAMDALGFGNPVLAPSGCSFDDYLPSAMLYRSYKVPCFGMSDTFPDLYSSDGYWLESDIDSLRERMRSVYEEWKLTKNWQEVKDLCKLIPEKFSYKNVGNLIKERLENE